MQANAPTKQRARMNDKTTAKKVTVNSHSDPILPPRTRCDRLDRHVGSDPTEQLLQRTAALYLKACEPRQYCDIQVAACPACWCCAPLVANFRRSPTFARPNGTRQYELPAATTQWLDQHGCEH